MIQRIVLVLLPLVCAACLGNDAPTPNGSELPRERVSAGSAAGLPGTEAPIELPPAARAAYERLRSAERFVDSMVGYDGGLPREAEDLRTLVAADPRGAACKRLFEEASPAGRLLALCGLWWRDPARFDAGVADLRASETAITVHSGCEVFEVPARQIVRLEGAIRLAGREQSIEEWIRANGGGSARLDIAGGGYPRRLLGLE